MISATEPIHRAISWTEKVLFKPFDVGKWFVLGFSVFLAQLGQGGYNFRGGNLFPKAGEEAKNPFEDLGAWVAAHQALAILIGAAILVVILGLVVLFMWLSSRGQFMFLDCVARNRAEVREPWNRFRGLGNRLFRFRLALAGIALGTLLILAGTMLLAGLHARHHGLSGINLTALIALGVILIATMFLGLIVDGLLRDFVVPVMYLRGVGVLEGFDILWRNILAGNGWAFVRFYLMKLVLGLASMFLILAGCCLTCCLAALPYLSSVVFLPIHVFFRSYGLTFLEQFGEEWRVLGAMEVQP